MRWLALACVLAGCISDEEGFHIVVRDKTGHTVSVDMYLAVDEPDGITAMKPEDADGPMNGQVFTLDSHEPPTNGSLSSDGEVVFDILPEKAGKPLHILKVVFIGRDRDMQAVSFGYMDTETLSLEAGGSVAYTFDLQEVAVRADKPSNDASPAGTRIFEWAYEENPHRVKCVDVEVADGSDSPALHYFFVPPDDPDCDGAVECSTSDDYLYGTSSSVPPMLPPATLDNVRCAQKDTQNGDSICRLGVMTANTCEPPGDPVCTPFTEETFCAPLSVCATEECLRSATPDTCFSNSLSPTMVGTYMQCQIPVTQAGEVCPDPGQSSAEVNVNTQTMAPFHFDQVVCTTAHVWHPGKSISMMDPDASTFRQFAAGVNVQFGITLAAAKAACALTLTYEGGAQSLDPAVGTVEIQVGMHQHVILPVRVTFMSGCSTNGFCQLSSDLNDKQSFESCLDP